MRRGETDKGRPGGAAFCTGGQGAQADFVGVKF